MLGIHFRLLDTVDAGVHDGWIHDISWNTMSIYIVTYVLIITFLVLSFS